MPSKELLDPSHQRRLQHDAQRSLEPQPHASTATLAPGKATLAASYAAAAPTGGVAAQLARSTQSATYSLVDLEAANRDGDLSAALHALGTVKRYVETAPAWLAQLPRGAYPQLEDMVHAFIARAERAIADAPKLSRPAIDAARRGDFSQWDAEVTPWREARHPNSVLEPNRGSGAKQRLEVTAVPVVQQEDESMKQSQPGSGARSVSSIHLRDAPDNARRAAWQAEATPLARALGVSPEIRSDEMSRQLTDRLGARGVSVDNTVHLHPDRIKPGTSVGREVLTHELVHIAQARLPGVRNRGAAEAEARDIAASGVLRAPVYGISRHALAADNGATSDVRSAAQGADHSGAPSPAIPGGHGSHKIKVDFGSGTVTGDVTLTLAFGKTGVPLPAEIKAMKHDATIKLNGFVAKLETAVLNGQIDDEIFDGVKVVFEISAAKVGIDGGVDRDTGKSLFAADLLSIGAKLRGDVGHWINAGPDVQLTLDGAVSIAIGHKLAKKLGSYVAAQVERQTLALQIHAAGHAVAHHAGEIAKLEAKRAAAEASGVAAREVAALDAKILEHRIQTLHRHGDIQRLGKQLGAAERRANGLLRKIEGKLARKVAIALEKKTVAFVAKTLAKAVPVVGAVSLAIDVVELTMLIAKLIARNGDSSAGSGDGEGDGDGDTTAASSGDINAPRGDDRREVGDAAPAADAGSRQSDQTDGKPPSGHDPRAVKAAQAALSPPARAVLGAITVQHGGAGPTLTVADVDALAMLVPSTLTDAELNDVIAMLRSDGAKAKTPGEVTTAVDQAVRAVRNHNRSITVDGTARPDLARGSSEPGEATSSQPADSDDPLTVVRNAPAQVIASWFREQDGQLVLSDVGRQWIARHKNARIGRHRLHRVGFIVEGGGTPSWDLALTFEGGSAQGGPANTKQTARATHHFSVRRAPNSAELVFESYVLLVVHPR